MRNSQLRELEAAGPSPTSAQTGDEHQDAGCWLDWMQSMSALSLARLQPAMIAHHAETVSALLRSCEAAFRVSGCSCQCCSAGVNLDSGRGLDLGAFDVQYLSVVEQAIRRIKQSTGGTQRSNSAMIGLAPTRPRSLLAQSTLLSSSSLTRSRLTVSQGQTSPKRRNARSGGIFLSPAQIRVKLLRSMAK